MEQTDWEKAYDILWSRPYKFIFVETDDIIVKMVPETPTWQHLSDWAWTNIITHYPELAVYRLLYS